MTDAEQMTIKLCGESIYEIEDVIDIEYPAELDAFIIVLKSGKKYLVQVTEYLDI